MATSLRAQAQAQIHAQTHQPQQSPTSPTSSVTTTPTSPHFPTHQRSQSSLARPLVGNIIGNVNGPYGHVYSQPGSRPSTAPTIHHPRPLTPELFRAPANLAFAVYLKSWGKEEIIDFLSIYNCSHHASAFQKNDIDGKCILDLDTNNLKEMGVVKVGERIKIHNGIKDLRRRAANSGPIGISRVELRLNGAATPPLEDVPSSSPGLDGLYTRDNHPGSGMRRLGSSRPPPLDLHSQQSRNNPPLAYQNVPSSIEPGATTPRQINVSKDGNPIHPPGPSRNIASSSTASSVTITPSQVQGNSVPAPAPAVRQQINTSNLNLRAPPSRDPGRRSPSPVNTDPTQFIDRPLPPAPNQSSAAEYASAIRFGEGRTTPTWGPGGEHQQGSLRQTPSSERRHHPPPIIVRHDAAQHRKGASLGAVANRSYLGAAPRAATSGTAIHPFAATNTIHEDDPRGTSPETIPGQLPPPMVSHGSNGSAGSGRSIRNAGYVVGTAGPMHRSASVIASPHGSTGRRDQSGSGSGTLSLEDLRKQLVKFINSEDGTTRTVNVSSCSSGVEVLERALKKFGKWGTGTAATTDTESDEDGDQLEIDGWGVYEELEYHEDCVPLSEAALLNICALHRDGTLVRDGGLILRRTRKPQYRKNMEVFLGEAPPAPMSPTSPGYLATPRPSFGKRGNNDSLTPTKASNKQKRASTVSVMSGLGVPLPAQPTPETPPSPTTTARSPSSGSFLTKSKKMYNFFGHRPPSELISNHLAEYFPSAKKRELEKTVRHSMLRMSMGPGSRVGSITSGERLSIDSPHGSERRQSIEKRQSPEKKSPEKRQSGEKRYSLDKSPQSRRSMSLSTHKSFTASPPADTILEEENEVEGLPRSNLSIETGSESERPSTVASIESQPPLLPPFEPATETLSESLQAFSPIEGKNQSDIQGLAPVPSPRSKISDQQATPLASRPRPKSIMLARRGSAGSSRSRLSVLSQLRKNRDKSDTASILTVDMITADVENRRASRITFEESDGEEELADVHVPAAIEDPIAPTSEIDEDEADEDGEDEASEEEEGGEEDSSEDESTDEDEEIEIVVDEDADHGKAYMSTGSKRIIKWIKGALIGAGSFGSVFLGMDSHSGLLMAVKQVELGKNRSSAKTQGMVDALEREVELLKELQHDNIVQYLDSSTDGDFLNIFLEYVPGGSVAALLNKYGAFEEALVKRFVRQILTGLEYLHARDIIHRDIKGANILVDNKGGIKISDFGISKKVESNLLNTGGRGAQNRQSLQGSVFWMAPEVVKQTGHSSKADIWSVGCLVVEMLTGSHPWPDLNQLQAMYQIGKYAAPALPNDISPETAQFLNRTFDLDHSARPTAAELLQHPFCTDEPLDLEISQAAAQATMAAAAAARNPPMQSLSALAEAR